MSSSYSSLDWVLSHWVHFTVHSLDLVVFICVYFVFFSYCIYVVLLSEQWGGSNGIEAWSLGPFFLQCFDTVGWFYWPIKPVPDMTYNVFGGMLNPAQQRQTDYTVVWCTSCKQQRSKLEVTHDRVTTAVQSSPTSVCHATNVICNI